MTTSDGMDLRPGSAIRPMSRARRGVALAACVALTLVAAGACSSDDAESTTTTEASGTSEPDGVEEESTETSAPLDDAAFAAEIAEFNAAVEAAGTDPCALNDIVTGSPPPEPANSAQSEQLVGLYAGLLRAIGASVPDSPAVASGFSGAADDLEGEAEAAGYPADLLSADAQLPPSLASEEFLAANSEFSDLVAERCELSGDLPPEGEAPTG